MPTIRELVERTRSYRRFSQEPLVHEDLVTFVDTARLCASGGNQQPLKYVVISDPQQNEVVFPHLKWAASLPDWDGPAPGERPTGYILLLLDKEISRGAGVDHGIAGQSICLAAMEKGIGACMIGSIQRRELGQALHLPPQFDILLVIALGHPGEEIVLDPPRPDGTVKYFRDDKDVHHVPKRSLAEVLIDVPV